REAAAGGLDAFLMQLHHLLERQRGRLAVLRYLAVQPAVADVGPDAAVEHLDVAALELLDDAIARDLFLFLDQEHRALEFDRVGIVLLLERGVGAAALCEGAEAADADADLLAIALAEHARKPEQVDGLLQRDRL